ncbi:MAG: helix-turn-helix domain-containing protein [Massiliimalia sp.]|jgi:transcriptional regulator with XRE-family HTH domain
MTFGERLKQLREEKGFNRNEFADYIGMPSTTLRNYETDVREPGHVFLRQMAHIFNVSIDYLLGTTDNRTPYEKQETYSLDEEKIIKKYRVLDEHGKKMVDFVLNAEYSRCEAEAEKIILTPKVQPAPTKETTVLHVAARNGKTNKLELDKNLDFSKIKGIEEDGDDF